MKKIKNKIGIVSEETTLLLENGDRIVLEVNDKISIKRNIDILRERYQTAVEADDTEEAEAIANELEKLGVNV
jgi:protein-arginine kinase activator protein McsA